MKVTKAAGVELSGAPSKEQLEKINRLTKTKVTAEDVYVFSVRLCDDQVDRDDERFSEACIRELAQLFVGKTGVMDHAWSAEKQTGSSGKLKAASKRRSRSAARCGGRCARSAARSMARAGM